jgi:hypothetical protein
MKRFTKCFANRLVKHSAKSFEKRMRNKQNNGAARFACFTILQGSIKSFLQKLKYTVQYMGKKMKKRDE